MSASENPEKNWALKETPVEDPIGLGERLALIDYFQEKGTKLDAGMTLGELRVQYWLANAQEVRRLALYEKLKKTYNLPRLSKNMSYKALLAEEKEAKLRNQMAKEQESEGPTSRRSQKQQEISDLKKKYRDDIKDVPSEPITEPFVVENGPVDDALWPPVFNKKMPKVKLNNLQGKKVALKSVSRGKPVLIEYVGMTCAGCNAFLGGNVAGIGPFKGQHAQQGLKSIAEYFPEYSGGLQLTDKRFTHVIILLYGLDGRTAPQLKNAQAYAKHYKLTEKENHVVLFGDASFINQASYNMIPGFQLIDSNWVVVSESTGHKPQHNFWTHTIPALKKLVD